MTGKNKNYSNLVRVVSDDFTQEKLKQISDSSNQTKETSKVAKEVLGKGAVSVAGNIAMKNPTVNKVVNKIEKTIEKIPLSDNMIIGTNKVGLQLGNKTLNTSFTVNKKGDANLKLSKKFTEDLMTELKADSKQVKFGLKFNF
jgi:hypothetical protein